MWSILLKPAQEQYIEMSPLHRPGKSIRDGFGRHDRGHGYERAALKTCARATNIPRRRHYSVGISGISTPRRFKKKARKVSRLRALTSLMILFISVYWLGVISRSQFSVSIFISITNCNSLVIIYSLPPFRALHEHVDFLGNGRQKVQPSGKSTCEWSAFLNRMIKKV
jgi:hypothetical protein